MSDKKDASENEKKSVQVVKKKPIAVFRPQKKPTNLPTITANDFWGGFDEAFERFRRDFQNIMLPSTEALEKALSEVPRNRTPIVDLEDRGKDFLLRAEMPGFKKEDIEIQVYENSIEITGNVGWKYDRKTKDYICKERACQSFYRMIDLPEEINADHVQADLKEGILEVVMEKKSPKQAKKINIK